MNKNDLKRILNKLTAAVAPYENVEVSPGGITELITELDSFLDCEKFAKFNFYDRWNTILRMTPRRPFTQYEWGYSVKDMIFTMTLFFNHFKDWMEVFCLCLKDKGYAISTGSGQTINNYDEETALVELALLNQSQLLSGWALARQNIMIRLVKKCRDIIKNTLTNPNKRSCGEYDYRTYTTKEQVEELLNSLEPEDYGTLINPDISPENDPVEVTPCVTVPVEQIETAFSNIPSIVTMGLVGAGVLGFAFWIRKGNFTKAMAAASAIAVASGASAAETQALNNALRGIAGPVMRQAANGQTFCPEPGTADTSSGG